jgi:uncharacterized membrane-anchored protein
MDYLEIGLFIGAVIGVLIFLLPIISAKVRGIVAKMDGKYGPLYNAIRYIDHPSSKDKIGDYFMAITLATLVLALFASLATMLSLIFWPIMIVLAIGYGLVVIKFNKRNII